MLLQHSICNILGIGILGMIRIFVTDRRGGFNHSHLKTNVWLSGPPRKSLIQKNTKMTAVDKSDSSLFGPLPDVGQLYFSFEMGFSFSLEARDKGLALGAPAQARPRRRSQAPPHLEEMPDARKPSCKGKNKIIQSEYWPCWGESTFKCDICGNIFKSDNWRYTRGKAIKPQSFLKRCQRRGVQPVNVQMWDMWKGFLCWTQSKSKSK